MRIISTTETLSLSPIVSIRIKPFGGFSVNSVVENKTGSPQLGKHKL
jgi:hypothetical protein